METGSLVTTIFSDEKMSRPRLSSTDVDTSGFHLPTKAKQLAFSISMTKTPFGVFRVEMGGVEPPCSTE